MPGLWAAAAAAKLGIELCTALHTATYRSLGSRNLASVDLLAFTKYRVAVASIAREIVWHARLGFPRQPMLSASRGRFSLVCETTVRRLLRACTILILYVKVHRAVLPSKDAKISGLTATRLPALPSFPRMPMLFRRTSVLAWYDSPPRLGKKVGVLGTRSPHRPNPLGLTMVKVGAF